MPYIKKSEATKRSKDRKINGKCTNIHIYHHYKIHQPPPSHHLPLAEEEHMINHTPAYPPLKKTVQNLVQEMVQRIVQKIVQRSKGPMVQSIFYPMPSYRFNHTRLPPPPTPPKKTLNVTKLTSCMNFRVIHTVIKCFERSTVGRIEENSNDVSRHCLFIR